MRALRFPKLHSFIDSSSEQGCRLLSPESSTMNDDVIKDAFARKLAVEPGIKQ